MRMRAVVFDAGHTLLELDYDDVRREAADDFDYPASVILANWEEQERVPWRDRFRYPQDSVITTPPTTEGTHAAE
jgi:FMN phosphatase YigB (HAD superfamily)